MVKAIIWGDAIDATDTLFECYFSESLEESGFSELHVDFDHYISMLLNQDSIKTLIGDELWDFFDTLYGTSKGIDEGIYFDVSNKDNITHKSTPDLLMQKEEQYASYEQLKKYFDDLNLQGKLECIKRTKELTELKEYKKNDIS